MPLKTDVINEIKPFGVSALEEAGDLMPLEDYEVDAEKMQGMKPGMARRSLFNRVHRQSAHMSAGLAQFIANRSPDGVKDDGDLDKVEEGLESAVKEIIADFNPATTETLGMNYLATKIEALAGKTDAAREGVPAVMTPELTAQYVDSVLTSRLSNCILEAPNGVAAYSGDKITVKAGLKVLISDGRNSNGTLNNIKYTVPEDLYIDIPWEIEVPQKLV